MPTYISLLNYTDEGMETIRESPKRLDLAKLFLDDLGGRLKDFYLTIGEYDMVVVFEVPNDEAAARFLLSIGSQRRVSTRTLKAFDEDAFRGIIESLPPAQ